MPTLQEIAEIENATLLRNSIPIANIKDATIRGMLYDLAEEGSGSEFYEKAKVYTPL